ncbi:major facilitator superfamily domain-containing protein [Microdochium trichocladiopsis]|uniref:Major facilitator superfamily domain-containing protein n=1 Tax=Microdochium trichocladiopsis TaxID=1682393 RepID=A0A9P8Y7N6_9PEZI|nr:major facilitator superfamily domain-containing protein [Microdochium trichocladiopsis]KAH7032689.1 major facilitator superfamily domain-containing protein [Microdochium trichocladiopsis]
MSLAQQSCELGGPLSTSAATTTTNHDHAIELEEINLENAYEDDLLAGAEGFPLDGGYGWVVAVCVFVANAHTWGINASWGVLLNHFLTNDSFPGASKFLYALIGGLSISQSLIIAPVAVAAHARFGPRVTMLAGALFIFAALCAAGSSTQIWQLILTQGFVFGWGMGFIYLPAMEVLPHWFSRHRSLAVGLAASGAGLGGLAYSLLTGQLLQRYDVVWTYRILSFVSLVMNLASVAFLRQHPLCRQRRRGSGDGITGKSQHQALNPRHFGRVEILLVVLWGFVTELGYITLLYSLPTYATSIGLDPVQGSVAQALLNLGSAVGRPIVGYYSDRVGRINIALAATFACALFVFALWLPAHSYGALLAFSLLVGTVCGTFWSSISPVLAEVVGLVELGGVMGSICFALVLPTTFAEAIAIQLVDGGGGFGAFLNGQVFVGCMFLAGALSLLGLRTWKIADKEGSRPGNAGAARGLSGHGRFWLTPRRAFRLERV